MVGGAVYVTLVPAQMVLALAAILTLAGKSGLTVIVTVFDEAVGLLRQILAFDVSTQLTWSLLLNVLLK